MTKQSPTNPRPLRPIFPILAVIVCVVCAGVVFWPPVSGPAAMPGSGPSDAPQATFLFGKDETSVRPFDGVPRYDPMKLAVSLPKSGCLYVVGFDLGRGTVCYYPTDFLGTDHQDKDGRMNAFDAGDYELPGTWDKKDQAWFVPDAQGALTLCVLLTPEPIPDLEEALKLTRQIGNRAFKSRAMSHYMPRAGKDKVIGRRKMPHPMLQAAMHQENALRGGPMVPLAGYPGVFVTTFHIRADEPRKGVTPPGNPFQQKIFEAAKGKVELRKPR